MTMQIPSFKEIGVRILVAGDVMLDRYWQGPAARISPEAPVPVVNINTIEERPGGAGNVALNLAALGCETHLMSFTGQDAIAATLISKLQDAYVQCHLQQIPNVPTITKLRILSQHQQLIRLDFEEPFCVSDFSEFHRQFDQQLSQTHVVILSDYGKGTLQQAPALIARAKQCKIPVFVDPKGRDFEPYRGATLLTPNRKEFETVLGVCRDFDEIIAKAKNALTQYALHAMLITCGGDGMILVTQDHAPIHVPAHAREVFDVTGAGDTVIAAMAACFAAGESLQTSMQLANWAASIVVGKLGAAIVSPTELKQAVSQSVKLERGIVDESHLKILRQQAKMKGETIVMTNGCFDLLHAGHVTYLAQAKALGDRLIVAVNTDDSVRRLKGETRPINSLHDRMTVLAALQSVDWVVPFSEETPERLITEVLPDILVKGGDYQVSQIAGAEAVIANGGVVRILEFVPGCSTSAMVKRIHQGETT